MSFLLLGLDSLIACLAIGTVVSRRSRLPLAALFGVADGGAFLLGAGAGLHISDGASTVLQTAMLVGIGLYLLVVAANRQRLGSLSVWAVPFALTLDNLTFGLVGDRSPSSLLGQAGQQALSSSLLALVGLLVAVELPRVFPALQNRVAATRLAGGALVLAAGVELLIG